MTRRTTRLALLATTLVAALALATCGVVSRISSGHIDVEQAELQARIAPRFPVRNCKLIVACLELANPAVVLVDGDDRITVTADALLSAGRRDRPGRVGLSGRPRYAPDEGKLYIDDLQVTTLELQGLPPEYAGLIRTAVPGLAKDALQRHPVYTLDTSTAKGALAKATVKSVKVVNGKLRISLTDEGH